MKVLVIGSGAREHALVRSLAADDAVDAVICAPGNAGIDLECRTIPVDVLQPDAVAGLATFLAVDLVVVGPEAPLVAGVADAVRAKGIPCFGPSAAAARLEGSKAFAKEVMASAGVPTAMAHVCDTEEEVAEALDAFGPPYVVKDDGLAAGKGVVVTPDRDAALEHARTCAGQVVVEEFLDGPEVSLFGITDGRTVLPMQPAQDSKRLLDGDEGPNTGGMGAYSPLPWAPPSLVADVLAGVLQPTIDEMARRGTPFAGLLYAGLALTSRGIRVIEFNARFGDPETQVVLARLRTPLGVLLQTAATGGLELLPPLSWRPGAAVTVVLACKGYPSAPRLGDEVRGLAAVPEPAYVLHAGTRELEGKIVSAGGRVVTVTATGASLEDARRAAYEGMSALKLAGGQYRSDIGLGAGGEVLRRVDSRRDGRVGFAQAVADIADERARAASPPPPDRAAGPI